MSRRFGIDNRAQTPHDAWPTQFGGLRWRQKNLQHRNEPGVLLHCAKDGMQVYQLTQLRGRREGRASSRRKPATDVGSLLSRDTSSVLGREMGRCGWCLLRVAVCTGFKHRHKHVTDVAKAALAEHRRAVCELAYRMREILRFALHEIQKQVSDEAAVLGNTLGERQNLLKV